jgi:ubiquinone/menaquinone biosynthesis C-methylase UbiE
MRMGPLTSRIQRARVTTFDADRYRQQQIRHWDAVASSLSIERATSPISERLLELAVIRPGSVVLDIGSGDGDPAIPAALRTGPTGRVIATDVSEAMLRRARQRVDRLELGNVEFRVMDAERLDLPDESVDAVLARFVLMFVPDVERALQEVRRVLAAGGRFATCVQASAERSPAIYGLPIQVAMDTLRVPQSLPNVPSLFRYADPAPLQDLLYRSGLREIGTELFQMEYRWSTLDEYIGILRSQCAPLHELLVDRDDATRDRVWAAIARAAARYVERDGSVRMPHKTIMFAAAR